MGPIGHHQRVFGYDFHAAGPRNPGKPLGNSLRRNMVTLLGQNFQGSNRSGGIFLLEGTKERYFQIVFPKSAFDGQTLAACMGGTAPPSHI